MLPPARVSRVYLGHRPHPARLRPDGLQGGSQRSRACVGDYGVERQLLLGSCEHRPREGREKGIPVKVRIFQGSKVAIASMCNCGHARNKQAGTMAPTTVTTLVAVRTVAITNANNQMAHTLAANACPISIIDVGAHANGRSCNSFSNNNGLICQTQHHTVKRQSMRNSAIAADATMPFGRSWGGRTGAKDTGNFRL